jgi:hypothetical protein
MAVKWCDKHAELFAQNGAPPEKIYERIVKALTGTWMNRPGMPKTQSAIELLIENMSAKKPFCCRLGDDKLQKILVNVSTDVEKMKEQYRDDGN